MMYLVQLIVLLILALTLLAVIDALIYAYKKLRFKRFLLLVTLLLLAPTAMLRLYERKVILQAVPDVLEVRTVAYRNEESWDIGPGGNEAGIRFYTLPEDVSRKVGSSGIKYFEHMPPNRDQQSRRWRGLYGQWSETPIRGDHWKINQATGLLNVTDYICIHGYCIDIPSDRMKQANEIVSKSGSFYAIGNNGIIVVSPEQNLVLYFYH